MKLWAVNKLGNSKKTGVHFTRTVAVACVFFIICVVTLWVALGRYSLEDEAAYQKLMQSQDESLEINNYTSRQRRLGVQKDIFFSDEGPRLQLRLQSARTQLALDHHDNQVEVVEQMHDVVCCIQEELFYKLSDEREAYRQEDGRLLIKHADPKEASSWVHSDDSAVQPMQLVRLVEADMAFYYYKNNQFLAENVRVAHYVAFGHTIDQAAKRAQSLMDGTASWVEFSLGGKDLNFKAHQLKAKFYDPRRGL